MSARRFRLRGVVHIHAGLMVVLATLVVLGTLNFLPFETMHHASGASPVPLQPVPSSPTVGSTTSLSFAGGPSVPVTVVAPGIAVYDGAITDGSKVAFQSGTSFSAPAVGNPDFIKNVTQVLAVIGNGAGKQGNTPTTGQTLMNFFAYAHPLPNADGTWNTSGPSATMFLSNSTSTSGSSTSSPSGINVVIGMSAGNLPAYAMATVGLNATANGDGRGAVSLISVPANLPAVVVSGGLKSTYVDPPSVTLTHELIHAAHNLSGGRTSGQLSYSVWLSDGQPHQFTSNTEEILTVGGPSLAAQANGAGGSATGPFEIFPNQAMSKAIAFAANMQNSFTNLNNGPGQSPASIASLRRSVAWVSENSYNSDVNLLQRPFYGSGADLETPPTPSTYQMANFTTALTSFTMTDQLHPSTSSNLVQPASGTQSATASTTSTSSTASTTSTTVTPPTTCDDFDNSICAGLDTTGSPAPTPTTPTPAAQRAVATYQATPAAQQAVTCAIAPGSVYVGGSGAIYDANTSALNYAIGQWNAAKVPVTFSTTAQYAGQSPDVQVAFSSLVPQNSFHLSGTCSSVTTLTLPMPNPVFTPTNNTAAINLEFLQGLGALMGLPDDTTLAKCASLMNLDAYNRLSQNECPSLEPTVWDVATVNSIYAPNATAGFPALSNITSTKWSLVPQAQSDAEGAPMVWANATTAASFQWTYVPWDTGSEGKAGYIVNADNGLCLSSGINSGAASTPIQMDCAAQNPQWDLLDTSVGTSVINIAGKFPLCIGQAVVGVAELVDCHSLSPLTIAPPGPGVPAGLAHVSVAPGYKIIGQGSSMCLNVWGGGYVSGTPVKVNTCAGTPNELFNYASNTKLVSVYDSTVTTPGSAAVASLCLTAQGDGTTNGTSIVASTCTPGEDDQMWTLEPNGNYTNAASGKCLTVQGASTSAGASVILWDCNSGSNEQWSMQTGLLPGSKLYSLIGNASGALSTSTSASNTVTNGATRFGVLTYNTPDTWSWLDNGGGQGLLEDDTNSGCLQVANAGWPYFAFSSSQNAQSALGTCVASPAGTLGLISNSDGTVSFSLPAVLNPQGDNTNYCLDIKGNNTSEGAPIYAYPCGSNYANQSWRILAPPEPAVINRPRRSFSLTMPNPVALIPPAPSEPLDPTMANPVITTTASSASAPEATSISDAVTISGTGGAALSVTWTLYGPVAPDSDGTCASANWSSSPPVISSGTLAANGDGTYTTPASSPLLSPGCFTWSESIPATTATAAVTTGLGVAGEVTTITEPLSG